MTRQTKANNKKHTKIKDLPSSAKGLTSREMERVKGGSQRDLATGQGVGATGPCDSKRK